MQAMKYLTLFENILGIYRNYLQYNNTTKYLILIRVLLEISFILLISVLNVYLVYVTFGTILISSMLIIILNSFASFYSASVMILSIIQTKLFKEFTINLLIVHKTYKKDITFSRRIRRLPIIFMVIVVLFLVVRVINLITRIMRAHKSYNKYYAFLIEYNVYLIMDFYVDYKYFLENLVFYALATMLGFMIKCLDVKLCLMEKIVQSKEQILNLKEINDCVTIYKHLVVCAKQLGRLFKFQVWYWFQIFYFCF